MWIERLQMAGRFHRMGLQIAKGEPMFEFHD
jgi:hypothetical protein